MNEIVNEIARVALPYLLQLNTLSAIVLAALGTGLFLFVVAYMQLKG